MSEQEWKDNLSEDELATIEQWRGSEINGLWNCVSMLASELSDERIRSNVYNESYLKERANLSTLRQQLSVAMPIVEAAKALQKANDEPINEQHKSYAVAEENLWRALSALPKDPSAAKEEANND